MATPRATFLAVASVFLFINGGTCNICVPTCDGIIDLIPDPIECGKFYQCAHGTPYRMNCPLGLSFSPSLLMCDYPELANCTADPFLVCAGQNQNQTSAAPEPETTAAPIVPRWAALDGQLARAEVQASAVSGVRTSRGPTVPIAQPTSSPIVISSSTAGQGNTPTPSPNSCVPPCPSPEALYPHPNDCTKYFHCAENIPYLKSCPPGQEYSGPLARCDWPEIAQCTATPDAPCVAATYAPQTTPNPSQTTPNPTSGAPVATPTTQVPNSCVPPCSSPEALYPHPNDCTKYFHCAENIPYLKSCPPGQEYSGPLARCDWPEIAQCTASPDAPCVAATYAPQTTPNPTSGAPAATPTTQVPNSCVPPCPSPEALYPHPNDCTKYFHCAENIPYLKSCPPGQEYSGPLARCDWPEIAQCTATPDAPCVAATYAPDALPNPSQTSPNPSQTTPSVCQPQCPWPYAYIPHPQDCTKFYVCDGQMNAFEYSCQPGLWYSTDTVRCDYPEIANCVASPQNPCDAYIAP